MWTSGGSHSSRLDWAKICQKTRSDASGGCSVEDDGLVAVQQDAVFDVPADGTRQDDAFDVAAEAAEVVGVVAVVDAADVLFDDRSRVEVLRHVMGGGADQLDAAVIGC